MTINEALTQGVKILLATGIDSAHLDAQILLTHVTGRTRANLLAHPEIELKPGQTKEFQALIKHRAARVPLVHLTGTREFFGLEFEITPAVLTPRVETERMVEWAIETAPRDSKLLDVGTGSGALAVAIKFRRPDLTVVATEISSAALVVARRNANKHKLNIKFIQSDLLKAFERHPEFSSGSLNQEDRETLKPAQGDINIRFATVVTNLPYLETGAELMPEVCHEPSLALFGGPDGLDLYRRLFAQLPAFLEPHAHVYTECDPWQQPALKSAAAQIGLTPKREDYFILEFQAP